MNAPELAGCLLPDGWRAVCITVMQTTRHPGMPDGEIPRS